MNKTPMDILGPAYDAYKDFVANYGKKERKFAREDKEQFIKYRAKLKEHGFYLIMTEQGLTWLRREVT
jgi:hypothetical protein